jgi:dsDNA-specific endonuclease/ATPase MutS2
MSLPGPSPIAGRLSVAGTTSSYSGVNRDHTSGRALCKPVVKRTDPTCAPVRMLVPHMAKITLDLHEIFNRGDDIDRALRGAINEAVRIKASSLEIIPGKGSGQLKKRVLRFLDEPAVKATYHRVEKDSKNFGRILVHFRWKRI